MSKIKVKVVREFYRVETAGMEPASYENLADAARDAIGKALVTKAKGVGIMRVTEHEPVTFGNEMDLLFPPVTETVTGEVFVPAVSSYIWAPGLSRYHPVNGWAVPETIEVDSL